MAAIPGSVPLTGKVAPTDTTDTFATHMDIYGEGGYMAVADTSTRNLITEDRRKLGMAVCTTADNKIYTLTTNPAGATTVDGDWTEFSSGSIAVVQTAKINITDAEVQLLHSTPKALFAPGVIGTGKRLQVVSAMGYLNIGYANTRELQLYMDGCAVGGGSAKTIFYGVDFTGMTDNTGRYLIESDKTETFGNNCTNLYAMLNGASGLPTMGGGSGIDLYITYVIYT